MHIAVAFGALIKGVQVINIQATLRIKSKLWLANDDVIKPLSTISCAKFHYHRYFPTAEKSNS